MSITCACHSQIEVCCMYMYELEIQLKNGGVLNGQAMTTSIVDRQEALKIQTDNEEKLIILDDIQTIDVLTDNADFKEINFD